MGQAYRDSGRTTPIMDGFAFHPYEDNSSVAPVDGTHPNTTTIALADYDKLVALLGAAFGDYTLPIWYDEFGVESQIPAAKQSFYTNAEPPATKPVTEATQAAYYRQAVQLAFCQPNVRGLFLFHAIDERDLTGWQSGLYYADDTPKSSLARGEARARASRAAASSRTATGLQLTVHPKVVQRGAVLTLTCDLDCSYVAQLYRLPGKLLVVEARPRRRRPADDAAAARARRRRRRTGCGSRRSRPSTRAVRDASRHRPARLAFAPWKASTSRTPITASIRRGGDCPVEERQAAKDAFADVVEDFTDRFDHLRAYTTTGVRPETDFFLWKITDRYEALGELGAALNGTPLAGWLTTPYSYLATTKASQYTNARRARKLVPQGSPYLVVYPFVKVRPWYSLSEADRQRAMDEHIRIGREEFPGIKNHTSYSFGIDDQEFMTAFECDEPADFMHLMLRLRDSEASAYTERDVPIFVGQHVTIREALAALDGASSRVEL